MMNLLDPKQVEQLEELEDFSQRYDEEVKRQVAIFKDNGNRNEYAVKIDIVIWKEFISRCVLYELDLNDVLNMLISEFSNFRNLRILNRIKT